MIKTSSNLAVANKKTSKAYKIIMIAEDATNDAVNTDCVVYTDEKKVYVRELSEFVDKFILSPEAQEFLDKHTNNKPLWMPIETAPKDGTNILVWDKDDGVMLVKWKIDTEIRRPGTSGEYRWAWCVPGSEQDGPYDHYTASKPTHWRPLPAPPKTAK